MTGILRAALITAALSLATPALHAQPATAEAGQAPAQGSDDARDAGAAPAAPQAGREETENGSPSSPFDYEASEEISEDLSVSFPVDI